MTVLPILAVKDFDASLKFYTEKLGFLSEFNMEGPDGKNVFGFVAKENVKIALSDDKPDYERGRGVVLMLYPDGLDIDAFYKEVQDKGVTITEDLKTEYWGDRVFSIKDPDGYYLTFGVTVEQVPMEQIRDHMKNAG